MATTPTTIGQDYGYLWWLNTQGKQWPDLPRTSFAALGAGSNTIWIDPEHDLVVVWRWHRDRSANEFFKRVRRDQTARRAWADRFGANHIALASYRVGLATRGQTSLMISRLNITTGRLTHLASL